MLLTGCAGVVLGAMIMLEWPLSGLFAIALFIAVDLLLQGVSMVWLALRARSQPWPNRAAAARPRRPRWRQEPHRARPCRP